MAYNWISLLKSMNDIGRQIILILNATIVCIYLITSCSSISLSPFWTNFTLKKEILIEIQKLLLSSKHIPIPWYIISCNIGVTRCQLKMSFMVLPWPPNFHLNHDDLFDPNHPLKSQIHMYLIKFYYTSRRKACARNVEFRFYRLNLYLRALIYLYSQVMQSRLSYSATIQRWTSIISHLY